MMSFFSVVFALLAVFRGDPWTDRFAIERIEIPAGIDPQIGGVTAMPDGRLAVCFHRGEVLIYDPKAERWSEFASGLHEPLGILAEKDGSLLVMQRCELTRLSDTDGDGTADAYDTVFDGFGMSGNYHEFGFGPARDAAGNLYVALGTASNGAGIRKEIRDEWSDIGVPRDKMDVRKEWGKVRGAAGRMYSRAKWRGWVLKLSPDGKQVTPFACGFRTPDGIGFDAEGRLLVTDNQGDWLGTSKVHHVRESRFYGHVASLVWREGWTRDPLKVPVAEFEALRTKAAALLPQGELANSPTQPIAVPEAFGVFAGQTLIGEMNQKSLVRFLPDPNGEVTQGAAIPFLRSNALGAGNHRMAFTDDGSLWIGKTHLSWAGAEGLYRVRLKDKKRALLAIDKVTLREKEFVFRFTAPVDGKTLAGLKIRAHGYKYFKNYGSPKVDDREVKAGDAILLPGDQMLRVFLKDSDLREGDVYTFSFEGVKSRTGEPLLGDKVYYTLVKKRS